MAHNEKDALDRRDLQRICNGLETYATLDAKAAMERLRNHKEDALCSVSDYSGNGNLMCTRDVYNAIIQLAERHRESLPVPDDYSVDELAEGIKRHVVRTIVDQDDDSAAAHLLSQATNEARKNHKQRTYHFPCVVVTFEEPAQFRIGAVTFTAAKSFPSVFQQELQLYVKQNSGKESGKEDEKYANERVQKFQEYLSSFGWLATVCVPPCAEDVSKLRAEAAVTTAIDLLRLVFGLHYGRDMHVAHTAFTQPLQTEYAVTKDGKFDLIWTRTFSGALVEKDWYLQMQNWQGFWNLASHLLETTVAGKRSEISARVEDALTWFGESAFETAPGKRVVNFVAALERLTTTESFSTHKFCSRVAMLAYEDEKEFEKTYWDAYAVHNARSQVMHGGYSPRSRSFRETVRIAHDLTRTALFRGLEVHCHLDDAGKLSGLADLQNFFSRQHSKWAPVLTKLDAELKIKRRTVRHP
jgi:hypothetical protein